MRVIKLVVHSVWTEIYRHAMQKEDESRDVEDKNTSRRRWWMDNEPMNQQTDYTTTCPNYKCLLVCWNSWSVAEEVRRPICVSQNENPISMESSGSGGAGPPPPEGEDEIQCLYSKIGQQTHLANICVLIIASLIPMINCYCAIWLF